MTLPFRPLRCLAIGAIAALLTSGAIAAPAASQGLQLNRVTTAYAPGDAVGVVQSGPECGDGSTREWSELLQRRVQTELAHAFADELAKAAAARPARAGATDDLVVSARLNELKLQLCDLGHGAWQGGFEVGVSWQLQRRDGAKPVLLAYTSGRFDQGPGETGVCPAAGLREALAQSVRRLLADPKVAAATRLPATADGQLADASGL